MSVYILAICVAMLLLASGEGDDSVGKIARMEFVSCPGCKLNSLPEASLAILIVPRSRKALLTMLNGSFFHAMYHGPIG